MDLDEPTPISLAHFFAWLALREQQVDTEMVRMLLELKRDHVDARPDVWHRHDLEQLFLEVVPREVLIDADAVVDGLADLATYLRFLDDTDQLDEDGDPVDRLTGWLEHAGPAVATAMDDPSRRSTGGALVRAMLDDGVDLDDEDAVAAWIEDVNAGSWEARDELLAGTLAPDLPLLVLPSDDELAAQVRATRLWRQVRGLVDEVGDDGLRLTDAGNLRLADARRLVDLLDTGDEMDPTVLGRAQTTRSSTELHGLTRTLELAFRGGLLVEEGTRAVADAPAVAAADADPVRAWRALVAAWIAEGMASFPMHATPNDRLLDESVIALLRTLAEVDEPMEVHPFADALLDELDAADDLDHDLMVDHAHRLAGALEVAGTVELTGVRTRTRGRWRFEVRDDGVIALTDLGRAFVAAVTGASVHRLGELAEADAATLLAAAADLPGEHVLDELGGWAAGRDPVAAARELVAATDLDDPEQLIVALHVLDELGPDAAPAVEPLASHATAGPFATSWLIRHKLLEPGDGSDEVDTMLAVLETVADHDGPGASVELLTSLGDVDDQRAFLDRAWRSSRPRAAEVLELLGRLHDDKRVAKAARKAAFRARSRGG